MAEVRNILFDYGNVIIDIDIEGAFEKVRNLYPEDSPELIWKKHFFEVALKYEVGEISTEIFINGVLKYAKSTMQALDVITAWNSMLIGIPPYRLTMLEQLRENYNVVLLSNTNAMHLEWTRRYLKETHGVNDFDTRYFDDVYYSHLIGLRKPDAACFKFVCENSFLTPKYTLFIDDMAENIAAARKLGFQTRLSPPEEEVAEVLKMEGFY